MYKTNSYATHQPFFIEILKNTTGDILECGCGDGSTIMIKDQIKNTSRKLVSLESNLDWLNKYTHLTSPYHELYYINAGNDDTIETGNKWVDFIKEHQLNNFEVIFLDSSPWMSRKCCFDYYLNKSKIIIIHDFDYFPGFNIIGKVTKRDIKWSNIGQIEKIECDLNDVVKNYKLFYPPDEHFTSRTGPPTLVCSNIMGDEEFKLLINSIEQTMDTYYK